MIMSEINIPSIDSLRPEYNKLKAIQALYANAQQVNSVVSDKDYNSTKFSGLGKPIYWNGTAWVEEDGAIAGVAREGLTRPSASDIYTGFQFFDTSLTPARPIYASTISENTVTWVDATGAVVS